jgi:hypothetical protein
MDMLTTLEPCIGDWWVAAVVYGVDTPTMSVLTVIPHADYCHRVRDDGSILTDAPMCSIK